MNIYTLTFISKNQKSLENAFLIFFNYFSFYGTIINKYSQKRIKTKVITLLKSPHINKSAQEQFESNIFSKQLVIGCYTKNLKHLFFIKRIQESLLSDVKLKITVSTNKIIDFNSILNLKNYSLIINKIVPINKFKNFDNSQVKINLKKQNISKVKHLLQILEINGEMNIKT